MKKSIVLCFVLLVILVPAFLFTCGGNGKVMCTKPTGPDYYYIRFDLDGEDIILNYGSPDFDKYNPWVAISPSEDLICFGGRYCYYSIEPDLLFFLGGWLHPSTPGEYIGEYGDGSATPIGGYNIQLIIRESGVRYDYISDVSGTLTITTIGDVGGDVEGAFDITFESYETSTPAPSYGSPLTAVGTFRLLRLSDDPCLSW